MDMQRVDVRLPDGSILRDIHLVDYKRQAAGVVPIGADGKILLIDHYRFQTDTRGWEIPAGKIDAGESAEQAATRELREETGHQAASLKFLGKYHPSNGSSNWPRTGWRNTSRIKPASAAIRLPNWRSRGVNCGDCSRSVSGSRSSHCSRRLD